VPGRTRARGVGDGSAGTRRELAVLGAVAEALNSAADVRQALEKTLALVADLLGLRTGWVWLLDRDTDQFYSAAARQLPPYLQEPVRMTGRWCECIGAFRDGDLAPKNVDVIECSRLAPAVRARETALTQGLRYHATIPLYFQDRPLGIMNVTGPEWRKLTREELRLLSTIAYQVGIAVERARLAEESTRLARAEERARIAREIHDTLAQGLTAIALHVEGALRALDADPERARQRLARALDTARSSLDDARQSVLDLRATPLAGRPLAEALAALARGFTSDTGVRVHVRMIGAAGTVAATPAAAGGVAESASSDGPGRLPLRVEAELYRIAQEALVNVRKHAQAREVAVTLRITPRMVRLSFHDDGRGVTEPTKAGPREAGVLAAAQDAERGGPGTARVVPGSGQGIQGMKERARLLGGALRIVSRPGRGTTVVATVPLPADGHNRAAGDDGTENVEGAA
jgi:two-component system NarL family sensor kinase